MKIIKICFASVLLLFLLLFLSYRNGYYRDLNKEKRILTDEKIMEYEEDLKNGVDVSNKEYVIVTPTYDNKYTRKFLDISKIIEDGFDGVIKYLFKKLGNMVDE